TLLYPLGWVIFYYLFGTYKNLYYTSRGVELLNTIYSTFLGSVIVFSISIIYKKEESLSTFYGEFFISYCIQTFITYLVRFSFLTKAHNQLQRGEIWFNTLIIGNLQSALALQQTLEKNIEKTGYKICGFVNIHKETSSSNNLQNFWDLSALNEVIDDQEISEVIIALPHDERKHLPNILHLL